MFAWAGSGIVEPLHLLFSAMWRYNTTPEHMTDVLVKYIPKHSCPSLDISEYRSISLISCLGKRYTMGWLPSLTNTQQPHITKHQGAFPKGTGALEQAGLATQLLQERREQGIQTYAAFIDLEKCYDTVWREGLYSPFFTAMASRASCPGTSRAGWKTPGPPQSGMARWARGSRRGTLL